MTQPEGIEGIDARLQAWFRTHRPSGGWGASAQAWMDLSALLEGVRREGSDEARGIRFRVEVACDGYENLTDDDVPGGAWNDAASYQNGAADAARAIRGVL